MIPPALVTPVISPVLADLLTVLLPDELFPIIPPAAPLHIIGPSFTESLTFVLALAVPIIPPATSSPSIRPVLEHPETDVLRANPVIPPEYSPVTVPLLIQLSITTVPWSARAYPMIPPTFWLPSTTALLVQSEIVSTSESSERYGLPTIPPR